MALELDDATRDTLRVRLVAIMDANEGPESSSRFPADDTRRGELADLAIDQVIVRAGPDTPDSVVLECAVRMVGWAAQSSAVFDQYNASGADGTSITRLFSHGSAIRASGALGLLAPWRTVRAFEGV